MQPGLDWRPGHAYAVGVLRTVRISQQVPTGIGVRVSCLPLAIAVCLAQVLLTAPSARAAPTQGAALASSTKQGALAPRVPPKVQRKVQDKARPVQPARPPTELERCIARAIPGQAESGVKTQTTFLLTGDAQVLTRRFAGAQCLGFIAAGARHVQSLELSLRAHDGRLLS